MKKIINIIITFFAFLMITTTLSGINIISYADDNILNSITYTVIDNEVTITDCDESSANKLVIPEFIENYPVTKIDVRAFENCELITDITLPDTLNTIGASAFRNCTSLESIIIPDSVTILEAAAFYDCTALTKVSVGDGINKIEINTFYNCQNLSEITFGKNVSEITENSFSLCNSLRFFTVSPDNMFLSSDEDGVLYNKKQTVIYKYPRQSEITHYKLKDSVLCIEDGAFGNADNLISIELSNGTNSIGMGAFSNCDNLQEVKTGLSLSFINCYAFFDCPLLKNITLPAPTGSMDGSMYPLGYHTHGEHLKVPDFTIYGYKNTPAHEYAEKNGFNFIALKEDGCIHKHIAFTESSPSCTTDGYELHLHCIDCGLNVTEGKLIPATGHSWSTWEEIYPGKFRRSCSVCHNHETKEENRPAIDDTPVIEDTPIINNDAVYGDVNLDNRITASDARLVLRVSAKLDNISDKQFRNADVNNDKKITAADARKILRVSAKLESF